MSKSLKLLNDSSRLSSYFSWVCTYHTTAHPQGTTYSAISISHNLHSVVKIKFRKINPRRKSTYSVVESSQHFSTAWDHERRWWIYELSYCRPSFLLYIQKKTQMVANKNRGVNPPEASEPLNCIVWQLDESHVRYKTKRPKANCPLIGANCQYTSASARLSSTSRNDATTQVP